jgi:broad specificity phosphatase PhoE
MKKQLWLIRHPEVEDAASQRFYGFHDINLSAQGFEQAGRLRDYLQRQNLSRIITTGLKRTDCLGQMLQETSQISWEVEPSLKEMDFGRWEALAAAEVEKSEPELYKKCVAADRDFRFPEGESIQEFLDRVTTGLEKVIQNSDDPLVAVVTHSGVVRMALIDLLNLDFQANWHFRIDYGSLSAFEIYEDFTSIVKINDTCHLDGLCPY